MISYLKSPSPTITDESVLLAVITAGAATTAAAPAAAVERNCRLEIDREILRVIGALLCCKRRVGIWQSNFSDSAGKSRPWQAPVGPKGLCAATSGWSAQTATLAASPTWPTLPASAEFRADPADGRQTTGT